VRVRCYLGPKKALVLWRIDAKGLGCCGGGACSAKLESTSMLQYL
jgi:hypothetical protein